MPRRRTATAIQVLNSALERVAIKETRSEPMKRTEEGSGAKTKEVKPTSGIKLPKEKKAELINTRILLTR